MGVKSWAVVLKTVNHLVGGSLIKQPNKHYELAILSGTFSFLTPPALTPVRAFAGRKAVLFAAPAHPLEEPKIPLKFNQLK